MAIYQYRCEACKAEFEIWAKMSDPPLRECPQCHAEALNRLISRTAFHLKGGGWYAQGYGASKDVGSSKAPLSASSDSSSISSDSSSTDCIEPSSNDKSPSSNSDQKKKTQAA